MYGPSTATPPLSHPDALPIYHGVRADRLLSRCVRTGPLAVRRFGKGRLDSGEIDRKSTRLHSSHMSISYGASCLEKKPWTTAPRGRGASDQPDQAVLSSPHDA